LGCGAGQLMYYLDECGYRNVTGIDISNEQVVEAKKHGVKKVECCSASTHLKKNRIKYDVIIAIDVFEHYTIDELFNILKLLKKSMKTKAKLVLHIPNAEGIFGMHACFHDVTHMNYYTPHSIKQCLLSEGFSEVQVFEDRPIVHGLLSLIRALIWMTGSLVFRIIAVSETGRAGLCLTQNIFVTARK
jgi:trans-aconitate methyltransferase